MKNQKYSQQSLEAIRHSCEHVLHQAMTDLFPGIKIPFAESLVNYFPSEHLIMRTHFERLLDFIKASTALYQFQRERDSDGYIRAESQDYDNAIISLKATKYQTVKNEKRHDLPFLRVKRGTNSKGKRW